jgi:hypothetical protein
MRIEMVTGYSSSKSSTLVKYFKYDYMALRLETYFTNGNIYYYYDVPHEIWQKLTQSEQQGKFFYDIIRNKYDYSVERPGADRSLSFLPD